MKLDNTHRDREQKPMHFKHIMQIWDIVPRSTDVRLTAAQNMQIQSAV